MPSGFHRPEDDAPRDNDKPKSQDESGFDKGRQDYRERRENDSRDDTRREYDRDVDGRFGPDNRGNIGRGYGKQHTREAGNRNRQDRRGEARMYSPRERRDRDERMRDDRRDDRHRYDDRDRRDDWSDRRRYDQDDRYNERRSYDNDRRDQRWEDRRNDRYDRGDRRPSRDRGYNEDRDRYQGEQRRFDDRQRDDRRSRGYDQRDDRRDRGYDQRDRRGGDYRDERNGFSQRNDRRDFDRRDFDRRDGRNRDDRRDRPYRDNRGESRGFEHRGNDRFRDDRNWNRGRTNRDDRPRFDDNRNRPSRSQEWRAIGKDASRGRSFSERRSENSTPKEKRKFRPPTPPNLDPTQLEEPIRLNKFIARSTPYSRRESDDLVKRGRVTVNGAIVGPGMMIKPGDVVLLDEKPLHRRDHLVYILLNKPKGVKPELAQSSSAEGGVPESLGDLLKFDGTDQLHAVLPLGADMLGLQLVSNDPNIDSHFEKQAPKSSFTLSLVAQGDADLPEKLLSNYAEQFLVAEYVDEERLRLSIVVRGAFPSVLLTEANVSYEKVDRLHFAGLTKKDLPRGHWRYLSEREITWVTMFQQ